jgi:putative SOS response-associated peptidase YedK
MFRDAALRRRCLVLSSGFYEWRHIHPVGKKGQPLKTTHRYPYHITLKDQPCFFMAGIWTPWTDRSTGETFDTFAIVTTAANHLMEQIHNSKKRMPVILTETLAAEWISERLSEERITEIATSQIPANMMHAHSIRKDFREALDPAEAFRYEELPELTLS